MNVTRRRVLTAAASAAILPRVSVSRAQLVTTDLRPLVTEITGGASLNAGRVSVDIPRLADNGHAVPLKVTVESAMTEADHVRAIHVLSERNPRPLVAAFHLNPSNARAEVTTRVRLNGTQKLLVIAVMSDGSFWSGSADVLVTESACLDES